MYLAQHFRNIKSIASCLIAHLKGGSTFEVGEETYRFESDYITGYWEMEYFFRSESDMYQDAITEAKEGDVFYDIGANIGCFSCIMGREGAEVMAFEPNPQTVQELRENLERNDVNAEILEYAASDQEGEAELTKKNGSDGTEKLIEGSSESESVSVEKRKLDNTDLPEPDIVKIDTEGHEIEVLDGMKNILAEEKPILYIEAHGKEDMNSIRKRLEERNYRAEVLFAREDGNYLLKSEPTELAE
jgi:FkbM family methyltransferase